MRKEEVIRAIRDYILDVGRPKSTYRIGRFQQVSYIRWICNESISRIRESNDPPLEVLERFKRRLDYYACMENESSKCFEVGYSALENLIDYIIFSGGVKIYEF